MYQPAMSDENVMKLYRLKLRRKRPMTVLLDEILEAYFSREGIALDSEAEKGENSGSAESGS